MFQSLKFPALATLLLTSAPALATPYYEPGKPYSVGDFEIPSQQTLPPATAPQLAFRPACNQLAAIEQANGLTAFGLPDPAGSGFITLSELPPGMPLTEAYLFLDAEGSCKLNGVDVPVLFAADL
ncbi:MAG: hypothetical protein F6K42_18895, partial [Leptolyngbya sp. SIO1D8]|nr:hypothetical protein [Leptolyngbya sp. SIO1D8]